MNKEVSFPIAKLLNEKGIIFKTKLYYSSETKVTSVSYNEFAAPTIADVVMWLYEKHGVWISLTHQHNQFFWSFGSYQTQDFNSPTEAYEAAIEYTLNNLI